MSVTASAFDLPLAHDAPPSSPPFSPDSAAPIWVIAFTSIFLAVALFVAGQATLLRITLPAAAAIIALALYVRRPIGFIHFTLWTWFLTPLLRRLVDLRFGFEDKNLVLVAPLLVTGVAGITFLRERKNARGLQLGPYLLCLAGICYGLFVGLIRTGLHDAGSVPIAANVYGFLNWSTTLLFGLHLYLRSRDYEQNRLAIQKTFLRATLLLGLYGIAQYILAPPWDVIWLEGVGVNGVTFGRPEPFMIRVFSTLNAPGPFGLMMQSALLLLFAARTKYKVPISVAGYLAFLLSQIRTAWLGWLLGVIGLVSSQRGSQLRRAIISLLVLPICLLPTLVLPQVRQAVEDRFATLLHVNDDDSFQDRQSMYQIMLPKILGQPSGEGLLDTSETSDVRSGIDSGIVQIPLKLGLVGAMLFAGGILLAVKSMLNRDEQTKRPQSTPDVFAYRAICLTLLVEVISGNVFLGLGGLCFWTFLALWMSSTIQHSRDDRPFAATLASYANYASQSGNRT